MACRWHVGMVKDALGCFLWQLPDCQIIPGIIHSNEIETGISPLPTELRWNRRIVMLFGQNDCQCNVVPALCCCCCVTSVYYFIYFRPLWFLWYISWVVWVVGPLEPNYYPPLSLPSVVIWICVFVQYPFPLRFLYSKRHSVAFRHDLRQTVSFEIVGIHRSRCEPVEWGHCWEEEDGCNCCIRRDSRWIP